jgi:hypothetical protein
MLATLKEQPLVKKSDTEIHTDAPSRARPRRRKDECEGAAALEKGAEITAAAV